MQSDEFKLAAIVERLVILSILVGLLVIHLVVVQKLPFLGFYYLPVLLAGYFCGKRIALQLSVLAVFLVVLYSVVEPGKMAPEIARNRERLAALDRSSSEANRVADRISAEKFKLHFSLVTWGAFLILSAVTSSILYDQKQRRIRDLKSAYAGVVEILTKYLELADRHSAGRSVKVADLATETAKRLKLGEDAVENIRIGALLHDLGRKEISALILEKSAELGSESGTKIRTFSVSGQEVVRSVSAVLEGVAPILNVYHEYFVGKREKPVSDPTTKGAEVVAISRAYYDMVTGAPMRKAKSRQEALEQIRASAGREFEPEIVEAFVKAVEDLEPRPKLEEQESGNTWPPGSAGGD